jgi:hypothetical protein
MRTERDRRYGDVCTNAVLELFHENYKILRFAFRICQFNRFLIQSDQKENKSEQALQIIGHVVAESYVLGIHDLFGTELSITI